MIDINLFYLKWMLSEFNYYKILSAYAIEVAPISFMLLHLIIKFNLF